MSNQLKQCLMPLCMLPQGNNIFYASSLLSVFQCLLAVQTVAYPMLKTLMPPDSSWCFQPRHRNDPASGTLSTFSSPVGPLASSSSDTVRPPPFENSFLFSS